MGQLPSLYPAGLHAAVGFFVGLSDGVFDGLAGAPEGALDGITVEFFVGGPVSGEAEGAFDGLTAVERLLQDPGWSTYGT